MKNILQNIYESVLPDGYKWTEVGVIPEDWDVCTIGKTMKLLNGRAFKPNDWKQRGIPIIRIQNLNNHDATFNYCDTHIEEKHRVEAGGVLFAWSGTTGTSFGARIWSGPTGVLNQHIFKVIADPKKLTTVYSFLILQNVQEAIEKQAHGFKASFVHVKKSDLVKISLPVPPLPEQHAIAEALREIDMLIGAQDQLITKNRDLKQAAMQQLLTGQTRLPGHTGKWVMKKIKEIVAIPVTDGPHTTPEFLEDGIPFLSVNNLVENKIDLNDLRFISRSDHELFSRKCKPQRNDLLLGKAASVGKVALVDSDLEFNIWSPIALIRLNPQYSPQFFYQCFQSTKAIAQITLFTNSSSQGNVGMGDIEKLQFCVPPFAEQTAIAEVLSDMDAGLAALEQRRAKTRALKQGMMQELLTGRTRLL